MRKNKSIAEEVNQELTYFCFRKPDPDSQLFHRPGLLRLYLQIAGYARFVKGKGQGEARVDTLPGWTRLQKHKALTELRDLGYTTFRRQGNQVWAKLTDASGVMLHGQDFDRGRGFIRVYRGPAFNRALSSKTKELELEVWLRCRAWYEDEWTWAEFCLRHVPGLSFKQARTALQKLNQNRVTLPSKKVENSETVGETPEPKNGNTYRTAKSRVRFLTAALYEDVESGYKCIKGTETGEKGHSEGHVYYKGEIIRDSFYNGEFTSGKPSVNSSNPGTDNEQVTENGVYDSNPVDSSEPVPYPGSEPGGKRFQESDIDPEEHEPSRALVRARNESYKLATYLNMKSQTRLALQNYLEMLYSHNIKLNTRYINQDLPGAWDPELTGLIENWFKEQTTRQNRSWTISDLCARLHLARQAQHLNLTPAARSCYYRLKEYLHPDSPQAWARYPREGLVGHEQQMLEQAQWMLTRNERGEAPDWARVCSLFHYAESTDMDGVRQTLYRLYSEIVTGNREWLDALEACTEIAVQTA